MRVLATLLSLVLVASVAAQIHVHDVSGSFPSGLPSAANLAIVSDGTTGAIKPTVVTIAPTTGNMSGMADITATGTVKADKLYADTIANEAGTGAPAMTYGATFGSSAQATMTSTGLARVAGIANAAGTGAVSLTEGAQLASGKHLTAAADGTSSLFASGTEGDTLWIGTIDNSSGTVDVAAALTADSLTVDANGDIGISGTGALKTGYIEASDGTAAMTIADSTGAITGVPSITVTGAVQGGSVTDGTATMTAGALSGLTGITSTGTLQVPAIKGGATSSVSATYGVTLPDDQYISSGETSTSAVVYRLNNATNTGLGIGGIAGRVGLYVGGNMAMDWTGSSVISRYTHIPGSASVLSLGNTANPWDDTYTDELFLQLSTPASEGKIHWEGAAGDSSMAIVPVQSDGSAPSAASNAVALSVKLAASPASGESVDAMRITSAAVLIPAKLNLAGSSPEAVTIATSAATFAVTKTVVELTGNGAGNTVTTITGGVEGDILILVPVALGGGITLADDGDTPTTNELALSGNCVFSAAGTQSITLLRGPTFWIELSRSLN